MQKTDEENIIFKTAADFINNSNHPVFLTGKAGTGKTTFLKFIREHTKKNTVVVAPTGVAAINAGGTTMHSFFQLPFGPYIPETKKHFAQQNGNDKNSLLAKLRLTAERKEIMESLELLIIDEVSMVRCDVLDAVDVIMRHVRRQYEKPFGGVQVLYIGDLYQLPPVIKEDWTLLSNFYDNQFFFNSKVVYEQPPVYIELEKVYRQSDLDFINLLNQVRNNEMDEENYRLLHSRHKPGFKAGAGDDFITLTTHNNKADEINMEALSRLHEKNFSFKASVDGIFSEGSFPADEILNVKTGAQVMFLKNDTEKIRRYYNGKIGIVNKIDEDKIWVECKQDGFEQLIEVKKETWRNIKYSLNKKTQKIEEEELGSFTQFPLRLAWAITIHKSQGLTFKNAVIDAGSAFASGQVYVALSRCTSLDGIILNSPIPKKSFQVNPHVLEFCKKQISVGAKEKMLFNASKKYQEDIITGIFDFSTIDDSIKDLMQWVKQNNNLGAGLVEWLNGISGQVDVFKSHGEKFNSVLQSFFLQDCLPEENIVFQQRFKKAADWFLVEIKKTKKDIFTSPVVTDNRQLANDYNNRLQLLFDQLVYKAFILEGLRSGFNFLMYNERKSAYTKESFPLNAYSGKSGYVPQDILHRDLYNELRNKRDQIAAEWDLAIYMVCKTQSLEEMVMMLPRTTEQLNHISGFGAVKIKQYGKEFINIIDAYCESNNLETMIFDSTPKVKRKEKPVVANKTDTKRATLELYKSGKSVSAIAMERKLTNSTIEGHLAYFIEQGELHINDFVDQAQQRKILNAGQTLENNSLTTLKERIPFASFAELKWMVAWNKNKAIRVGKI